MKCPQCKSDLPASSLACPFCTEKRSREAILEYQRLILPAVLRGATDLRIARVPGNITHLELFGDADHAYCGAELKQPKRSRHPYTPVMENNWICPGCCLVLNHLLTPTPDRPVVPLTRGKAI